MKAIVLVFGFLIATEATSAKPVSVVVSILPYAEIVKEIAGKDAEVSVMVPPGASPHHYDPKPSQLTALSRAAAYIKVGTSVEFEVTWLSKLVSLNPAMRVIDASEGISLLNQNGRPDPHIWISVRLALFQVKNIGKGLLRVLPGDLEIYKHRMSRYIERLKKIDQRLTNDARGIRFRTFYVIHPFLGYLAHDYDLRQIPLSKDGHSISPSTIKSLFDPARQGSLVLVVPEHELQREADVIAQQFSARLLVVDAFPAEYSKGLERIADSLFASLKSKGGH